MIFIPNCGNRDKTKDLEFYIHSFGVDLNDFYIVCIVPIDGCESCISKALLFSKDEKNRVLLIVTSLYSKSINSILRQYQINNSTIITDNRNLAISMGLVQTLAPSLYLLKDGKVIKVLDLSNVIDQESAIKEAKMHLNSSK